MKTVKDSIIEVLAIQEEERSIQGMCIICGLPSSPDNIVCKACANCTYEELLDRIDDGTFDQS